MSALALELPTSWESEGWGWCGEQNGCKATSDLLVGAGGDKPGPSNQSGGQLKRAEGFRAALEGGARDPPPPPPPLTWTEREAEV